MTTDPNHRRDASAHHLRGRRARIVVFTAMFLVVAGSSAAYGYFGLSATGQAQATALTIGAATVPSVSVSGRDVSLSWTAATNATGYAVARANVIPQSLSTTLNGTCSGGVTGTSCVDAGLPESGSSATNWTYTDTGTNSSWSGATSSPSATVSIPAPSVNLVATTFSTAGGTTNATVTSYFDNENVTFCVDQSSSCPTADVLGTATLPASGGSVTKSISLPSGLSVGSHTVYAIGSAGSLASETITVGSGSANKLAFVHGPSNATVGATMAPSVTVQVEDQFGNPVSDSGATITLASTPSVTVIGKTAVTGATGLATFSGIVIDTAGSYTVTATSTGLSSTTSTTFTVAQDTTTTHVSETPAAVSYGNESASVFTATATTTNGEAIPSGDTITVSVNSGAAACTVTLPGTTCSIGNTALPVGGPYTVSATFNGDTNLVTSTASSTTGLTVNPESETTTASLSVSQPSVTYGFETTETFSGTVTGQTGDGYPEGTVAVDYGSAPATQICSVPLTGGSGDTATYTCTLTASQLALGSYTNVVAVFTPGTPSSSNGTFAYTGSSSTPAQSFSVVNSSPIDEWTSTGSSTATSPTSITSVANASYLIFVNFATTSGSPKPSLNTGTGSPFSSATALSSPVQASSNGNSKSYIDAFFATGNGNTAALTATVTGSPTVISVELMQLSPGATVVSGSPTTVTGSSSPATAATSGTSGDFEVVAVGTNSSTTITTPPGMTVVGTVQTGPNFTLGVYTASQSQTSTNFILSSPSGSWGTITYQFAP